MSELELAKAQAAAYLEGLQRIRRELDMYLKSVGGKPTEDDEPTEDALFRLMSLSALKQRETIKEMLLSFHGAAQGAHNYYQWAANQLG